MKHLKKVVALAIVLLVFSLLMLSGPRASVTGAITVPSGSTAVTDTILNLEATLTTHSGDVINTSAQNVLFKIYVPFPIFSNTTINSSDILLSGSTGYGYYDNTTSVYAYCYGYPTDLVAKASYTAHYTGDYILYVEINYTHIDDYGHLENATYRDSKMFTVSDAFTKTTSSGSVGTGALNQTVSQEYSFEHLKLGDSFSFKVNHLYHTATLTEMTNDYIVLDIQSDIIPVKLLAGETKQIDIDGDGINDIEIYFKGFLGGEAYVSLKVLEAPTPEQAITSEPETPVVQQETPAPIVETPAPEQPIPLGMGIVTVAVMVIVGIIVYVIIKKSGK